MDDQGGNEYVWLGEYEKTWEALEEDEQGSLRSSVATIIQRAKRRQMLFRSGNVRIGMVRHLYIIIDGSSSMYDRDLRPNRFFATIKLLEGFVDGFFDQNPISQLGLMAIKNKRCELLTDLSGNTKVHLKSLSDLRKTFCEGEGSLYNAMDQAYKVLKHMPSHVSREILVIYGSLSTIDPVNIDDLVEELKTNGVKCSIIGLSASVAACQRICKETNGKYHVVMDETHFKSILEEHLMPPVSTGNQDSSLIKMGFPQLNVQPNTRVSMCMCHLDSPDVKDCFGKVGYLCPQCSSKYCELPVECVVCGLMLASSAHLARSYHHLFPLEAFEEVSLQSVIEKVKACHGCQKLYKEPNVYRCKKCSQCFCTDCDIFVHESLHSCPGCASKRAPDST